jgi:hypothetical protein
MKAAAVDTQAAVVVDTTVADATRLLFCCIEQQIAPWAAEHTSSAALLWR